MKSIVIVSILAVLTMFVYSDFSYADNQDFEFRAGFLEDSYLPYEPIVLDLMVTNVKRDTLRVKTLSFYTGNVSITLVGQKDDTLKPTEHIEYVEITPGKGILLQAGETYYTNINLVELYGRGLLHKRLLIGSYQIQVRYSQRSSPILSFEVKEPKGIEKKAYELLKTGYNHQLAKEPDQAIRCFQDIITRIPKSEYVELAYFDLAQSYRVYKGDTKKSDSLETISIDKFPNSYFSRGAISRLSEDKNSDERREFLNQIIKRHPNTRSAKFAQQMLKGW